MSELKNIGEKISEKRDRLRVDLPELSSAVRLAPLINDTSLNKKSPISKAKMLIFVKVNAEHCCFSVLSPCVVCVYRVLMES